MAYQPLAWQPPVRLPSKPVCGYCDVPPNEPAVAGEFKKGEKKRRFCKPCWETYKRVELGLKPLAFKL